MAHLRKELPTEQEIPEKGDWAGQSTVVVGLAGQGGRAAGASLPSHPAPEPALASACHAHQLAHSSLRHISNHLKLLLQSEKEIFYNP